MALLTALAAVRLVLLNEHEAFPLWPWPTASQVRSITSSCWRCPPRGARECHARTVALHRGGGRRSLVSLVLASVPCCGQAHSGVHAATWPG